MSARMRSRALALACSLALGWTPSIRANPVVYSTSGTVEIANEPDPQIVGVSGVPAVADSTGQFALGDVRINAVSAFPVSGWPNVAPPNVANSPFDIRLDFGGGDLPSLELKGVLNPGGPADRSTSTGEQRWTAATSRRTRWPRRCARSRR